MKTSINGLEDKVIKISQKESKKTKIGEKRLK